MTPDDLAEVLATPGAEVSVSVYGDTADQVELAALDAARGFFGPDRQLVVLPGWRATKSSRPDAAEFVATVTVRALS